MVRATKAELVEINREMVGETKHLDLELKTLSRFVIVTENRGKRLRVTHSIADSPLKAWHWKSVKRRTRLERTSLVMIFMSSSQLGGWAHIALP